MSVIPQTYNQGTGFIGSANTGTQLPNDVDDLIVNNTLTVLGTSTFENTVTINSDLNVTGTTTLNNVNVTGTVDFAQIEVDNLTVNQTLTSVLEAEFQGTIGAPGIGNKFSLPVNGPPANGDVIKLDGAGGSSFEPDTAVDDYVSFDTVSEQFVNNPPGGPAADITAATFDTVTTLNVGRAGVEFELPAAAPAANQVLTALNVTQTEWADPAIAVQDYLTYAPGPAPQLAQVMQQVANNGPPIDTPSMAIEADLGPQDTGFVRIGNSNPNFANNPILDVNHTQPGNQFSELIMDQTGTRLRSTNGSGNTINLGLQSDAELIINGSGNATSPFNFFMVFEASSGDFKLGYPNSSVCLWPKNAPSPGDVLTVGVGGAGSIASPFPLEWA